MKKTKLFYLLFVPSYLSVACATKCKEPVGNCNLEPEIGPCEALIPKYQKDKDEGECKEFHWGGCEGVVPFDTMEECLECIDR